MKRITARQWGRALYALTQDAKESEARKRIGGFIELLRRERAFKNLPSILAHYREFYNQAEGILDVTVQSVRPIPKIEKEIRAYLGETAEKVEFRHEIVPELIGGLILRFRDIRIDASLRRQLIELEKTMNV